ncbi:hypothetical protein AVEN_119657-1 [Araneus ventricosus]|uniref:Uncharacterized protein n=1 Tax=Araneus ventricosus TaxID=182803 RepID=A0A4Y2SJL6_ARAVE|nr:hypothetical protein AVEN_119657-1 [Araneus ventricosus]
MFCWQLKQAIHICSKMDSWEHGKEKAIVKVESILNLEEMILSGGILNNLKSKTSCADSNLKPRYEASGTSKGLPRLGPRDECRKSEIRRVCV